LSFMYCFDRLCVVTDTAKSWDVSPASAWTSFGNILRGVGMGGVREGSCEDPSLSIGPGGDFHILAHCYSTIAWNGTAPGVVGQPFCAGHLFRYGLAARCSLLAAL
jgi:hypothetical protein